MISRSLFYRCCTSTRGCDRCNWSGFIQINETLDSLEAKDERIRQLTLVWEAMKRYLSDRFVTLGDVMAFEMKERAEAILAEQEELSEGD